MIFPTLPQNGTQSADSSVEFDAADVEMPPLNEAAISEWLQAQAVSRGKRIDQLSYVFASDEYVHRINVEYLDHDTYTDIITFDLRDKDTSDATIEGECYISVDRVRDNARTLESPFEHEFARVIVHGLLHLCGLGDKLSDEAKSMRAAEDEALLVAPWLKG